MHRLILVEGLPGSGKTTLSKKIASYLREWRETNHYNEGEAHPTDLAWCACVPSEQLEAIYERFPEYRPHMEAHMTVEDGVAIIPYTRFPIEDQEFYALMESFELYDHRVGFETFCELHLKRWQRFAEAALTEASINVFECAYLQNHINELLLFHEMSEVQIESYLLRLIDTVHKLNPVIIYLDHPDVSHSLRQVSDARVDSNGERVWMDRVIAYIESCPFGKSHHLKGFEGMVAYFEHRKSIELRLMQQLPVKAHVVTHDGDWEQTWRTLKALIDTEIVM